MEKSKLIEVLKTLSKTEFKEFSKYVEGTATRKVSGVLMLFNYLKKHHPEYPEAKIDKEVVYKKLFKEPGNVNKKMLDLMSRLYQVLEDFLLKKELYESPNDRNFLVLQVLKKRKLDKLFFQKVSQVKKEWEKETPAGIEQLYNEYKLAKTCFIHPNYSLFPGQEIDQHVLVDKLDKHYFAAKLHSNLCIEATQFSLNKAESINYKNLVDEILSHWELNQDKLLPQITLLGELLSAYRTKNFDSYHQCKKSFFESIDLYDVYESHDLFATLQHSAYENYRLGKKEFLREIFELNKLGAEYKLFIENGYIPEYMFKNVVIIACTVNELDWTKNFIEEYKSYLDENSREDIVQLCKAILEFHKGNFEESLQAIAMVKLTNAAYGAQLRELQLKCYYELEEYEELFFNMVRSFGAYISRNDKLSPIYKEGCQNFIKYANKLKLAQINPNGSQLSLEKEIEEHSNLNSKTWLLEKTRKL